MGGFFTGQKYQHSIDQRLIIMQHIAGVHYVRLIHHRRNEVSKVIVCDKCGHEGCNVSEILPPEGKISMADYAKQGRNPYCLRTYSQTSQCDREWEIICPECEHSIAFTERADRPLPYIPVS